MIELRWLSVKGDTWADMTRDNPRKLQYREGTYTITSETTPPDMQWFGSDWRDVPEVSEPA